MSRQQSMSALNRFPRMMQEYLTARLRENYRANHERVMGLSTRDEAVAYCTEVRDKTTRLFAPWPERTPLNVRVTGELHRGAYTVRTLLFDSRPGFPVSALLYVPRGGHGPHPAVLSPCGHSWQAKASDIYQTYPQTLARLGYVVLIYDPPGQAERLQYPDGKGESLFGPGPTCPSVKEHNAMDRQLTLTGDWIGRWFVWDGIRALDVLLDQDEVDPTRVGVTGVSGGGTMSTYAVACDDRITMSAPCCWISSWYHNGINEEPIDAEQCPPGVLKAGLEQSDLLLARAPKPLLLVTEEQDFFDQRGSLEAYERLRHVYGRLDAEENLTYYAGDRGHGYWEGGRKAMYAFFNRHAGIEANVQESENNVIIENPADLQCTPTGQVSNLPGAKCVPELTAEASRRLAAERGKIRGNELADRVKELLGLAERPQPPDYRILRPWTNRGYSRPHANQFAIETDPRYGVQAVVTKLEDLWRTARPLRDGPDAMLYLPHLSSDRELREDERIRQLETENPAFFACDYRGIGESRPDTCRADSFFGIYGSDYHYASYAVMVGSSMVAWRVYDVLCTLDWMASFGYDRIHLVAQGWGTIPGALTALLDVRVVRVTLVHALRSYSELAEAPMQKWPLSAMLPGVLKQFDLPNVYDALKAKGLRTIEPWGPKMGVRGLYRAKPGKGQSKVMPLKQIEVEAEETVYSGRYSNNGASPMWCLGNTCIVRLGEDVFVSAYERLPDLAPYNDCRWVLLKRTPAGWERQQADESGRQREPCPLGCLPDGRLVLSSNPTLLPPDASGGGPACPELIEIDAASPKSPARREHPQWSGQPPFNQHSYRSMAADGTNGDLILFQNVDYSHSEWAFRGRDGEWLSGQLQWPPYSATDLAPFGATRARVNYPVVRLHNRAVHFMGQSSYDNWSRVTTAEELERYTGKDAGSMGGWIFGVRARRLRYTWTEHIGDAPFHKWIEIDDAFDDGGLVFPGDMHVDETGTVHLLWYKGPMQKYARDKWFSDIELQASIRYATLRDGKILQRRVLAEAGENRTVKMFGEVPNTGPVAFYGHSKKIPRESVLATPRFHVMPGGRLFVVYYVSNGEDLSENRFMEIYSDGTTSAPVTIPLKHPLQNFFTATPRAGCTPSYTLDLLGTRRGEWRPAPKAGSDLKACTTSYAEIRIE